MADTTPEQLARAIADCRLELAAATGPPDIEAVERRLAAIERALRALAEPARTDPTAGVRPLAEPRAPSRGLRIAVPLRQFVPGMGGTGIYTRNVLAGLARNHGAELTIFTVEGQVETLRETVPDATFHTVVDEAAGLSIEQELDPDRHDVLFCPLSLLDPPRPAMPAAVTIHDLGHEYHPENFGQRILELRRRTFKTAARNADLIFTVSDFSKRGIVERFGVDPDRVRVAPPGASAVFTNPAALEPSTAYRELALPGDYLYYPANYWPDKNHGNLLAAMVILRERFPGLELVLSGAPGPDAERVADLASELGLREQVRMLGFVDQSLVCELARHSRAVPYVSQFEGFGIPVIEAMHAGAPVVTSMAEACLEVSGEAALHAPYDDPPAIAAKISRLLEDPDFARELSVRGKRRAQQFSWSNSVAAIADALERIAEAGRRQRRSTKLGSARGRDGRRHP